MKNIVKNLLLLTAVSCFLYSCGEDEEIFGGDDDPISEFDARLNTADTDSLSAVVFLTDVDDNIVDVFITFSSDGPTMRRLYSTINIQDQGEEAFDLPINADKKGDGSLELDGAQGTSFAVNLDIATSSLPTDGTVVYKFWTTTGRGDYRDVSKRQATDVMTLTIQVTGVNPDRTLVETTDVKLIAPLADASSSTFTSNVDCNTYKINQGEEFAAFWDFGFYYLNNDGISLASTEEYPELFCIAGIGNCTLEELVSVNAFLGIDVTEVNKCYFAAAPAGTYSSATVASLASSSVSTSSPQVINNLTIGDEVYLLDQYGKRGILKVTDLVESFGSDGFIEYDIKIEK